MTTSKDLCQLNFLTFKNRGHTYVRAYRNAWIPKKLDDKGNVIRKAGSAPCEQHQVGALLPSAPPAFSYVDESSDMVCDFVSDTVSSVPVYHLGCLPDTAAAELTFKTVFCHGE